MPRIRTGARRRARASTLAPFHRGPAHPAIAWRNPCGDAPKRALSNNADRGLSAARKLPWPRASGSPPQTAETGGGAPGKPGCQDRPGRRMDRRRSDRRNPVSRRRNNYVARFRVWFERHDAAANRGDTHRGPAETVGATVLPQSSREELAVHGACRITVADCDPCPDHRRRQQACANILPTYTTPQPQ